MNRENNSLNCMFSAFSVGRRERDGKGAGLYMEGEVACCFSLNPTAIDENMDTKDNESRHEE